MKNLIKSIKVAQLASGLNRLLTNVKPAHPIAIIALILLLAQFVQPIISWIAVHAHRPALH
jgi:hypothetical protein